MCFNIGCRNVLRATIDIPRVGEVNFQSTLLDHLDENWRMKQINAIIESNDGPHILAGGLNSFDETDYSPERWTDIVKVVSSSPLTFLKTSLQLAVLLKTCDIDVSVPVL